MAWYRSGTVSLTNGSTTVTGSGTAFIANASIGEGFVGPDGRTYEITDIPSNTALTISPAYLGSTASGQSFAILPARGRIADLIAETQSLLASFATVRDGIGAGLFPDGSATTPGLRFSGDQDTGIYRAGANLLGVSAGGVGRLFIEGSGNVIIGDYAAGLSGNLVVAKASGGTPIIALESLGVWNASISTNSSGQMIFSNPSNTARMVISSAGNVGIGITAPADRLHFPFGEGIRFGGDGSSSSARLRWYFDGGFNRMEINAAHGGTGETRMVFSTRGSGGGTSEFHIDNSGPSFGTTFRPGADNANALGTASNRWSVVYAGTGTINTSDEREKHWRGELNAAELRAAKRIIGELGIYQWIDQVAEKGEDGARLHFGVRAQRAFAIMEDEGLDWGRYAWACYDQWEEQTEPVMEEVTVTKTRKVMRPSTLIDPATGQPAMVEVDEAYQETEMRPTGETRVTLEADDRYGVRPDQLAFWLIAAQAAIQADLEARLAALEGAA